MIANDHGLKDHLVIEQAYAYPISHINEMLVNGVGEKPHVIELRNALQMSLGFECFAFNYARNSADIGLKSIILSYDASSSSPMNSVGAISSCPCS